MNFEINVKEESQLLFREAILWHEEAPLQRLYAGSFDSSEHLGLVIGAERADFERTTVAKIFDGPIFSEFRREKCFSSSGRPIGVGLFARLDCPPWSCLIQIKHDHAGARIGSKRKGDAHAALARVRRRCMRQ